jgi:hypothetical protein
MPVRGNPTFQASENPSMSSPGRFLIALLLSVLSGLSFIAGSPQMELVSRSYANFGGIALGALAALAWIAVAFGAKRPR